MRIKVYFTHMTFRLELAELLISNFFHSSCDASFFFLIHTISLASAVNTFSSAAPHLPP